MRLNSCEIKAIILNRALGGSNAAMQRELKCSHGLPQAHVKKSKILRKYLKAMYRVHGSGLTIDRRRINDCTYINRKIRWLQYK